MMERPTKGNKSSTTKPKITPITCYVICEGCVDESKYFEAIASKLRGRYQGNLVFVPIERSSTASAPKKVFEELEGYIKKHSLTFGPKSDNYAFMIIDRDHHFGDNHLAGTMEAIESCSKLNVSVLINVPSFEIWEICHFKDVSQESEEYITKLFNNRKESKNGKPFAKKEVRRLLDGSPYENIVFKVGDAMANETKLRGILPCDKVPPTKVQSNVGSLFNLFEENGFVLQNMFLD